MNSYDSYVFREKVLELVGNEKWSIKCDRVVRFLNKYDLDIDKVYLLSTTDGKYFYRKRREKKYCWDIIKASGGKWNYFTFVYADKEDAK